MFLNKSTLFGDGKIELWSQVYLSWQLEKEIIETYITNSTSLAILQFDEGSKLSPQNQLPPTTTEINDYVTIHNYKVTLAPIIDDYDIETFDILNKMPEILSFIEFHTMQGSDVIILCKPSLVTAELEPQKDYATYASIAYLMNVDGSEYPGAITKLKEVIPDIILNTSLEKQFRLWFEMNYCIDPSNTNYQIYSINNIPTQEISTSTQQSTMAKKKNYRCGKCGRSLWEEKNMMQHERGAGQSAFMWTKQSEDHSRLLCTSYFLKPMKWMNLKYGVITGKLFCPKCNDRLGSFNWAGNQCSCGSWVAPAFQIHEKRIR